MTRNTPWLLCRPPQSTDPTPRMRLFCLPHAGGGATGFHTWPSALPAGVQVCAVLLPGRETRFSEPPIADFDRLLDAIAEQLRPWLDLPFAVYGHSMGALLAFEWVRTLERDGARTPQWVFLSGRRAPDAAPDPERLCDLPDRPFVEALTHIYQGIPEQLLQDPELLDFFLPILRADISVVESYRFRDAGPLQAPLTVFAGVGDRSVTWDQLIAWRRHTRGRFAAQLFPGGHFYPEKPMLGALASALGSLRT